MEAGVWSGDVAAAVTDDYGVKTYTMLKSILMGFMWVTRLKRKFLEGLI